MLVTDHSLGKGFFSFRQLVQLAGDADPLGCRAARELALPAQPIDG
jgi:hypothetical protein